MYWSTNLALADEPDDGPGRPCTSFSAFVSCTQHSSASASNVSPEFQQGYVRSNLVVRSRRP